MSDAPKIAADGTLITKKPVELPDVLEVLIVGGGPTGTAAAFRAKELGISALVIDFDDLMKRIRDYAKDKLILPDFGGGDKMKFPKGGGLIKQLYFNPIDKDDMCLEWKTLYVQNNIPAHIGIELTKIQQQDGSVWEVITWNHNTKSEQRYRVKHIIISIGRGVPRRFDIPGNTDGISYRLSDAKKYVEGPALVIGGGTSAAEAVIAISNEKIKAKEPSAVYWVYRGERMPKVSKALADVFFDAYMGNGNIRHFAKSEPVAVVTAEDRNDYLSIRTDRKCIDNRPNETHHLEFRKEQCIACIGEDIPEAFLNSLGIFMGTGGPKNKKRMLVTPNLETQQPNVYLVGDMLSPAYFQTSDFDSDPATYEEIKRRGNVKSALRDGVRVIEIIKQKLDGKTEINLTLEDEEEIFKTPAKKEIIHVSKTIEAEGPPAESVEPERAVEESQAMLVRILPGDVEAEEYTIKKEGVTTIGKKDCDINFPEDSLMSEKHASISHTKEDYFLRDDGSSNGVFLKAKEAEHLEVYPNDLVRAGKQFLVFTKSDDDYCVIHYDHTGKEKNRFPLSEKVFILGRDAPDYVLDENDMTLSRRHLAITVKENKIFFKDLKSVNGTYLKVRSSLKIEQGTQFIVGQQRFIFSLKEDAVLDAGSIAVPTTPKEKPEVQPEPKEAKSEKPEEPEQTGGLAITFKKANKKISITEGQTICEVAEENELDINAECHAGICGSDPIRIISGKENLNQMSDQERETLEEICELDPDECRMACVTKPKGPVEVEIL